MIKKRFLTSALSLLLAASTLLLASCGDDPNSLDNYGGMIDTGEGSHEHSGDTSISNYGMHYDVPEGFTRSKSTLAEYVFSDGTAYLYFNYYDEAGLEEIGADPKTDVRSYAIYFCSLNDFDMSGFSYDEATDTAEIKTVFEFSGSTGSDVTNDPFADNEPVFDLPPEYFHFKILRGTYFLYIVTASCPAGDKEKYAPIFESFQASVKVD